MNRVRPVVPLDPGVWDLAGGHVEAGEIPASALVRELSEELGILIEEPALGALCC